jgi:hypothetical protein
MKLPRRHQLQNTHTLGAPSPSHLGTRALTTTDRHQKPPPILRDYLRIILRSPAQILFSNFAKAIRHRPTTLPRAEPRLQPRKLLPLCNPHHTRRATARNPVLLSR